MNKQAVKIADLAWNAEKCASMTLTHFTKVCNGYADNGKCPKPSKDEVEKLHKTLQDAHAKVEANAKNTKN